VTHGFMIDDVLHPLGAIAGIQPHIVQRINDFQVTAALVHAGLGVVLLPRHSVPTWSDAHWARCIQSG